MYQSDISNIFRISLIVVLGYCDGYGNYVPYFWQILVFAKISDAERVYYPDINIDQKRGNMKSAVALCEAGSAVTGISSKIMWQG